jgi:anti-sigma factor RsiW
MNAIDHLEAHSLLHAALDGELDTVETMRFEAHLADCADCAGEFARLTALKSAIRDHATRHAAPDALRAALTQSLMPAEPKIVAFPAARPRNWLRAATGGFAVGAAMAAGLAVMIDNRAADDELADSVVAAHIRALQPGHLTDVQVSDQHQVKPWFDGRIDFAPPVKELSDQGFDLVGGRLDYFAGRNAAVVVYRRRLHLIDLFVTRASGVGARVHAAATPSGYNVESWSDGGLDYWAVSDLNKDELGDFVSAWKGR